MAEVELRCAPVQEGYHVGEEIRLRVELVNGSAARTVNARLGVSAPKRGGELFLEVQDASGKEVPFSARVNIGAPEAADFKVLQPGGKVERVIDLSNYFTLRSPGAYTVRAVYENAQEGAASGQPAWKGRVTCPEVTLRIEPKAAAKSRS